jgi:hypothetical protein
MNDGSNPNSISNQSKIQEDDKYMKIFQHLEGINMRNKATFDELLRYTYTNVTDPNSSDRQKD